MEPYQEAVEATKKSGVLNAAKNVGIAALGARAAGSAISRILPLLSSYVPESFAKKGLEKIDPRLGMFLKEAGNMGATFDEAKDYIKNKVESSAKAQDNRNIIEQESPELHSFLDQEIRKGRKPIEAAALAQNDKRFTNVIKKLMKAHKTPWSSIIESVFGKGDMGLPSQQQAPQQQQSGQSGQGIAPEVAQILQQGNAILNRRRGV